MVTVTSQGLRCQTEAEWLPEPARNAAGAGCDGPFETWPVCRYRVSGTIVYVQSFVCDPTPAVLLQHDRITPF